MKKMVKKSKELKKRGWTIGVKIFVVCFGLSMCFSVFSFADEGVSSAFSFLKIGKGAKPVSMGEAYTALANDVNAVYWNPGGLGEIKKQEVMASYLKYVVDINSGYFGYVLPLSRGGLGIGVTYLDYGKIESTTEEDPTGENTAYYRPYDISAVIGYGRKINEKISLGVNLKGICENIDGYTAQGVAIDLGMLYDLPVEDLILGFTVKNLGVQTKAFIEEKHDLPLVCNLGLGYMLLSNSFRLGLDLSQPEEGDFGVNVGGEYIWREMVSLRLGYKSAGEDLKTGSSKDGLTGFGIGLGVNMKVYYLDYAFVPFNELGDTHRVSIGMKWGGARVEDKSFRLSKERK